MKRKIIGIALICIVFIFTTLYVFRNAILRSQVSKKIKAFNEHYHANLAIGQISMKGLGVVRIHSISLVPPSGDTLFKSEELNVHIRFWKLVTGRISFKKFELKKTVISVFRQDSLNNYSFLLDHKKSGEQKDTSHNTNYYNRISGILDAVFDKLPSNMSIVDFMIKASIDSHFISIHTPDLKITGRQIRSLLNVTEDTVSTQWYVESRIDNPHRLIDFKLYSARHKKLVVPFTKYKYKSRIEFDTARFVFAEQELSGKVLQLNGMGYLYGLVLNNRRIATEDVLFNYTRLSYQVNVGKDYFELDSSSVITFNKLSFNPYIRLTMYPYRQVILRIDKKRFPAQDLFESLPGGLFTTFEGIETKGDIAYHLYLNVNYARPDTLKFESELKQYKFKIVHFGKTNFTKINDSFYYTAYDNGKAVRSFYVGPRNPNYRSLDDISLYLEDAVITSEDGTFFNDRGFRMDAIKRAIATNIKKKRFVQGGSTITMQLVKNVFLNRKKTIARKLEEIMITWLIDYNGLVKKERIFEVYLNIAEWGPGIYGANEAAHYYFNKDASQLTLAESIFLANILPHPKTFNWLFDEDHHLKAYLKGYYNLLSGLMLKRGVISEDDKDALEPDVQLTGPARKLLKKIDTARVDTNLREDWF